MKKLPILTILLLSFILINCRNTKEASESKEGFKTLALEKLGEKAEFKPNEDNSMVLCYKKIESPKLGAPSVAFFVYDNKSKSVIYEDKIDRGSVSWYDNTKLDLYYTPGIMREDQSRNDFIQVYDLITKEKVTKSTLVNDKDL